MSDTMLRTPIARLSFPNLFEPKLRKEEKDKPDAKPRYSAMFLFDKAAQETKEFKAIVEAVETAIKEKWPKGVKRDNFKYPIKKGSQLQKENGDWLEGCDETTIAINADTFYAPGVINRMKKELKKGDGDSEIYAGCYVLATVSVWAFDNQSKGVKFNLGSVMKVRDGEKIGGRRSAASEFEDIEIEETAEEIDELAAELFP